MKPKNATKLEHVNIYINPVSNMEIKNDKLLTAVEIKSIYSLEKLADKPGNCDSYYLKVEPDSVFMKQT